MRALIESPFEKFKSTVRKEEAAAGRGPQERYRASTGPGGRSRGREEGRAVTEVSKSETLHPRTGGELMAL